MSTSVDALPDTHAHCLLARALGVQRRPAPLLSAAVQASIQSGSDGREWAQTGAAEVNRGGIDAQIRLLARTGGDVATLLRRQAFLNAVHRWNMFDLDSASFLPAGAGSWVAGGCGVFARAAVAVLPSARIVGIWTRPQGARAGTPPTLQHLAIFWDGVFFDAEATLGTDEGAAVRVYCAREHVDVRDAFVREPTATDIAEAEIPVPESNSQALARVLDRMWSRIQGLRNEVTAGSRSETIAKLTAELRSVPLPGERERSPALVARLMTLGTALLPGARLDVAETLAVLHLLASRGEHGFSLLDVERYKQQAIKGGYVRRDRCAADEEEEGL